MTQATAASTKAGRVPPADFELEERYTATSGRVIMSGVQALARLPLDQHRADSARGLHTAGLIAGYRGSPLGGLDFALERIPDLLRAHHIRFIPAVNEELAATAIMGSQTANLLPEPSYDGVCGMWYGKGPGVDRSGDAFKHANLAGVGTYGAVLALAGDDPSCKSSTIPSHSEVALYDALMPTFYPGSAQEILELGLLGFALSRFSGLWCGMKIVSDVADEFSSVEVGWQRVPITLPDYQPRGQPWQPRQNSNLIAPYSLQQERELHDERLGAALAFARANAINEVACAGADDRLGIIAAGKTWQDLRGALEAVGLDDAALQGAGIRLLKLGMIFPLEPEILREFAAGLDEVLIIEEKRAFIETFVKAALYGSGHQPRILGKQDADGAKLVKADNELDVDEVTRVLGRWLGGRGVAPGLQRRLQELERPLETGVISVAARQPYFCSGCPHNRSTLVPAGSLAGAGIGCHTLSIFMDRDTAGVTQMGGEGANWVGAEAFTELRHIFQNIGDGTFAHSGSLSIRQATAAGATMTFKILYNSAVAMTGGQVADGLMPVPRMTYLLYAEGVKKTIVISPSPEQYPVGTRWAPGTEVWARDRLDEAQRLLRGVAGVSAIIYDQECAANLGRKRRRGLVEDPRLRVVINEAVCEGCGDCGVVSNCLSVQPVATEFGRKTRIHQSSCNKDYSCLDGNCPAFVTVLPADMPASAPAAPSVRIPQPLPEPQRQSEDSAQLFLTGIGGTGVVTANQVLGTAAALDGFFVRALDQTGLSQKGGPVVSNLKISRQPIPVAPKIAAASADALLVFDLLTATAGKNLRRAHPQRSIAIVSTSQVPTGRMVRDKAVEYPAGDRLRELLNRHTRAGDNVFFDAIALSEALFGDHMMANMLIIGAAYQAGCLPMRAAAIERAIALNGVKVEANMQAFRAGRAVLSAPDWVAEQRQSRAAAPPASAPLSPAAQAILRGLSATGELRRLLELRVPELIAYQNEAYARRYVQDVMRVQAAEAAVPGKSAFSEAVARYLFKLMAYKDEYEVARLSLVPAFQASLQEQFGRRARIHYHLQPPLLKSLGLQRKLKLGRWFEWVYRGLYGLRFLRGSALDPFAYDRVRRQERAILARYRELVLAAAAELSADNYARAVELAQLPDMVRGYDTVKLDNIERFWAALRGLGDELPVA